MKKQNLQELRTAIRKAILKEEEHYKKMSALEGIILNSLDFSEENVNPAPGQEIQAGLEIFRSEVGHHIQRVGFRKALESYLRGLPGWIHIPIYPPEIENLMYAIGFNEVRDMDVDEVEKLYYDSVTQILMKYQ